VLKIIENRQKIVVILFFIAYFILGLFLFDDYGLAWDDVVQRDIGIVNFKYISQGDKALLTDSEKYHGPAFEVLLFAIELGMGATISRHVYPDTQLIYLMRHLITFLMFFAGVVAFYHLCKHRFGDWKIGLLGSILILASPRIFAHSFYNPKDITFMAMFIISMLTLVKYLEKRTLVYAFWHALACGYLIGIRVMGILVPCLTFFFIAGEWALAFKSLTMRWKKEILHLLVYVIFLAGFTILFWPILWEGPVHHIIEGFKDNARHIWTEDILTVLYFGRYIPCTQMPWHYTSVWIGITTPPLYLILFIIGLVASIGSLIRRPLQAFSNPERRQDALILAWFFIPMVAVVVLHSVLYDGYRHMFFVYPPLLLIALRGLLFLWGMIKRRLTGRVQDAAKVVLWLVVILSVTETLIFMIEYHPYQNLYFNHLAGRDMNSIKEKYELDYWGLSYREALEYILENDADDEIPIYVAQLAGSFTRDLLGPQYRPRLKYVHDIGEAKYFVSNYRWHEQEYPYENEFFSIKIRGTRIIVVYRMKKNDEQPPEETT